MLGKLHLTNDDIPQDKEQTIYWLNESAGQGNIYAQHLLDHLDWPPSVLPSVTRLFYHIGYIFRDNVPFSLGSSAMLVDRKLHQKIRDKRIAMGHRLDDYVEYQGPTMSM